MTLDTIEAASRDKIRTPQAHRRADAGVDELALIHLLPNRDTPAIRRTVAATFDGDVLFPEDGDGRTLE